jgi:formylmethanofuran:tetrahydromethanopterin formyltransferase
MGFPILTGKRFAKEAEKIAKLIAKAKETKTMTPEQIQQTVDELQEVYNEINNAKGVPATVGQMIGMERYRIIINGFQQDVLRHALTQALEIAKGDKVVQPNTSALT